MMESQEQIEKILNLCKENNKILKGMRSQARWSGFFSIIYYIFIIGSMVGIYYYIQPIVEPFVENYEALINNIEQVTQNLPTADSLNIDPEKLNEVKKLLNL